MKIKLKCPGCGNLMEEFVEQQTTIQCSKEGCGYWFIVGENTVATEKCSPKPQPSKQIAVKKDTGKPEFSIIPWEVIEDFTGLQKGTDLHVIVKACHDIINSKKDDHLSTLKSIFAMSVRLFGLRDLASSMMFGAVKYSRDNWKTGFGGDYRRILECVIRHGVALADGEYFDYEAREGFPKGNIHAGAIVFNLMVALNEISIYLDDQPFFEVKK